MATITLKGNPIHTCGTIPSVGTKAKNFVVVGSDLSELSLTAYAGKRKILSIVPSLDTGICATSTRKFNESVGNLRNTILLVISSDLPFAQSRFCDVEGLKNVVALSSFRSTFADEYGLRIIDGPLKGLNSRCVIVLDEKDTVVYSEQVPEIGQEPDYKKVLLALA